MVVPSTGSERSCTCSCLYLLISVVLWKWSDSVVFCAFHFISFSHRLTLISPYQKLIVCIKLDIYVLIERSMIEHFTDLTHSIECYVLINSTCICHNIYKGRISETKTPGTRVRVMVLNATFNNMSDPS